MIPVAKLVEAVNVLVSIFPLLVMVPVVNALVLMLVVAVKLSPAIVPTPEMLLEFIVKFPTCTSTPPGSVLTIIPLPPTSPLLATSA